MEVIKYSLEKHLIGVMTLFKDWKQYMPLGGLSNEGVVVVDGDKMLGTAFFYPVSEVTCLMDSFCVAKSLSKEKQQEVLTQLCCGLKARSKKLPHKKYVAYIPRGGMLEKCAKEAGMAAELRTTLFRLEN